MPAGVMRRSMGSQSADKSTTMKIRTIARLAAKDRLLSHRLAHWKAPAPPAAPPASIHFPARNPRLGQTVDNASLVLERSLLLTERPRYSIQSTTAAEVYP